MLRLATIIVCVLVLAGGGCEKAAAPVKVHAGNTMPASHLVEYMGDGDAGRTIINLAGKKKVVTYHAVAGDAVVEGDIILCSTDEAKRNKPVSRNLVDDLLRIKGVIVLDPNRRWPNKTVAYAIDPQLPSPERVSKAILEWEHSGAGIHFVKSAEGNHILFSPGLGCGSPVGMQGGEQKIILSNECGYGQVMHEIGHAVGLFHEQSRTDRDTYVEIISANIAPGREDQFTPVVVFEAANSQEYDYCSIMHYPPDAFAKSAGEITVKAKLAIPSTCALGQRERLSAGDLLAVKSLYP